MISMTNYWRGRDVLYRHDLTPEIEHAAGVTVALANRLLVLAADAGIEGRIDPKTGSALTSGWRPPAVNAATPGAAATSKHMTGQAIDLYDPTGALDAWILANPQVITELGLWQEHPSSTVTWAHVQTVAPRSGNRVFYP